MSSEDELFLYHLPSDWEATIADIERDLLAAGNDSYSKFFQQLRDEIEECRTVHHLIERQGNLLRGVVNAIKGDPPELVSWSHHDAPELAKALVEERDRLKAQLERPA